MNKRILSLSVLAAALTACATGPAPNASLEQARTRVRSAQADVKVVALAPGELKRADESLKAADKAWSEGAKPATVDHLAYMTGQRVTLAQETASSLSDQEVTTHAAMERDQMRLAMRTNEADTANAQLADSQQSNAQKSSDLADAQRSNAQKTSDLAEAQRSNAQKTSDLAAAQTQAQRDKEMAERRDARVNDLEVLLADMKAKKTDRGIVVTLGDVLFDSGKSQLRSESVRNMMKLADAFKRDPKRTASIEGYTDSVGSASSNLELSGRRAGAVRDALVSLGVPSDHLSTAPRGEESPVADNGTVAGRQMNRRVEIVFAPDAK